MKNFFTKTTVIRCLSMIFMFTLCIIAFFSYAAGSANNSDFNLLDWLVKNWEIVALILSEIAALLPGKISGIIHLFVNLIGKVIGKLR